MADEKSGAEPQSAPVRKPAHGHGAAGHLAGGDLDADTREEFLALYADASANVRFAKSQQWHTLIYFSALCAGEVAVGVWLRWGDHNLIAFLFYLLWLFSLATIGTILMLQSWQNSEARKMTFMRGHFSALTREAMAQKSRGAGDVHRYLMLGFMLLYVEMATFAVSRMLWPHF